MGNSISLSEFVLRKCKVFVFRVFCNSDRTRYFKIKSFLLHLAARIGLYEGRNLKLLRRFVNEGDTVVDVGANFGVYTTALANLVGHSGVVYAFEPLPWIHQILKERHLRYKNIVFIPEALSDYQEESDIMNLPLIAKGLPEPALASLERGDLDYESVPITVNTLDHYINDMKKVSFIKVDIEGHEKRFLVGAEKIIESCRPIIQLEENNPAMLSSYLDFCNRHNYVLVDSVTGERLKLSDGQISTSCRNIYLVPKESKQF